MFTFKVEALDAAGLYFHTVAVENVQIYRTGTDSLSKFLHQFELTFLKLVTVASQVWYWKKKPFTKNVGYQFIIAEHYQNTTERDETQQRNEIEIDNHTISPFIIEILAQKS